MRERDRATRPGSLSPEAEARVSCFVMHNLLLCDPGQLPTRAVQTIKRGDTCPACPARPLHRFNSYGTSHLLTHLTAPVPRRGRKFFGGERCL